MPRFDKKSEAFLKEVLFGKLATLMRDGRPQLTPVWYMYEDGKVFVNTARGRVKYNNIKRDPRVSLLVDDGYRYLVIAGKARVAGERDPLKDIETLAIRYRGEKGRKSARTIYWKQERVTIEILPDRIIRDL